jgi:hypothetical protein
MDFQKQAEFIGKSVTKNGQFCYILFQSPLILSHVTPMGLLKYGKVIAADYIFFIWLINIQSKEKNLEIHLP